MKNNVLIFLVILSFVSTAVARIEKFKVIKVLSSDAILEDRWRDKWLVDLGIGCLLFPFEGREILAEYGIDLDSPGAKLILPNGQQCRLWGAERID